MKNRAVCVTGMGAISCLGLGVNVFWERVRDAETGITDGLGSVAEIPVREHEGRAYEFSMIAAREALAQAGLEQLDPEDGFILATTTGQIDIWAKEFVEFLRQKSSQEDLEVIFRHQSLGALLDSLT
ncbi:MAG: hypothetical protein EOP05_23680, partial [Proteobacteria bacterium]